MIFFMPCSCNSTDGQKKTADGAQLAIDSELHSPPPPTWCSYHSPQEMRATRKRKLEKKHSKTLEKVIRSLSYSDFLVLPVIRPHEKVLVFHHERTNLGDCENQEDPMEHINALADNFSKRYRKRYRKQESRLFLPSSPEGYDAFDVRVHQGRCTLDVQHVQGDFSDYPKETPNFAFHIDSLSWHTTGDRKRLNKNQIG